MKKTDILIYNIKQSNLSEVDKDKLINILNEDKVDKDKFIYAFIDICKLGKDCLKLFDIDIGDFF